MEGSGICKDKTLAYIESHWENWYVKGLGDFIRVPNLTPMVDKEYLTNGLVEKSMDCVDGYVNELNLKGISKKIYQPEGSTPLLVYVIEAINSTKNVMLYGHLDKQPWMAGWAEGLSPTDPVIRGDYMYGRGGADDGYSVFSCMLAIKNAQEQGVSVPRCVMVLETEEESGSPNLIKLLTLAKEEIGTPDFCFCMDSGAFDYNQMWVTSSLRGICMIDMTVECGKSGYHSGEVGGIVPETFRVVRELLSRLDDPKTGKVIAEFETELPPYAFDEAKMMAAKGPDAMYKKYHVHEGVQYLSEDNLEEMYLNNTWRANLAITGASGLPDVSVAGNVIRSSTTVRCSMRLPPNMCP
jgi:acetylornithine deacetylase/succinyl-diaminopimelate desuccinylase-like protein